MDLRTRAIKSTAWYAGTRLWVQAVSWAVTLGVARLLTPQDYGLFAMALTVIGFLELFQEAGLGVAIVQRQDLTRPELNGIFWVVSTISLCLAIVTFAGAGLAANFYAEPRLLWITRLLGFSFLLNSLGMVPYNLLTMEIDFRRRSLAEAYGVLASAGVSIGLAYLEYGVWALVGGYLVRSAVRNAAMSVFCRWAPGLRMSFSRMNEVLKFGLLISGAGGLWELSAIANNAIVGRFLGGQALGLYSMAQVLAMSTHKLFGGMVNQVSLPVFSKLQRDDEGLRSYLLKIMKYLAMVSLPLQVGMVLVAHDLVLVLLSEKWLAMVRLCQLFAVGGIFYALFLPCGSLLTGRGRGGTIFTVSAAAAVVMTIALVIGAQFGLAAVAIAWLVVFAPVRLAGLALSFREVNLRLKAYLETISSPLLATVAMTIVVLLVGHVLPEKVGAVARLALAVTAGVLTYFPVLLKDKTVHAEVKVLVETLLSRS